MLKSTLSFIFMTFYLEGSVLSYVELNKVQEGPEVLANTIYYIMDSSFKPEEDEYIRECMNQIRGKTCLEFKNLAGETIEPDYSYITFLPAKETTNVCEVENLTSYLPAVVLAPHCFQDGWVIHEILHTLGFEHEHQREDRDCYVEVHSSKLKDKNYERHGPTDLTFPYDIHSVMHYRRGPYMHVSEDVLDRFTELGSKDVLSEMDVWRLNYKFCKGPSYCDRNQDKCNSINATNVAKGCLPNRIYLPYASDDRR